MPTPTPAPAHAPDPPTPATGLTAAEAAARLAAEGANALPDARRRSTLVIALDVVREPMFLLLVGAGALYLLLGNRGEAAVLLASVFVVMGITLYQEKRTEGVLQALRDLSSPRALVIRDGQPLRIAGREVVRGDLVVLVEGDRIPADGAVIEGHGLQADESLLTGESVPVAKGIWDRAEAMARPGGEGRPFVYSGTLVVQGKATAQVLATGAHTEIGRIGKSLQRLDQETTPLQAQTAHLVKTLALVGLGLCVVLVASLWWLHGDWIAAVLSGITLAMAILPEEFPVVLTVFLALGAWRLSRSRVLTRRVAAIETLGAATVLCVDKTGTLTQNRMAVHTLVAGDVQFRIPAGEAPLKLPEALHEVLEFGILASDAEPFDPMDQALQALGKRALAGADAGHLHRDWELVHEYALSPELRALSHVWQSGTATARVVAAKGAPEAIADLCHLDAAAKGTLAAQVDALSAEGLRVLGVAQARFEGEDWPADQHAFAFTLVGLVALADPLRPSVPAALQECREAGIRVVMITGDYPGTAAAIAREAGLDPGTVISGDELGQWSDAELGARIHDTTVFARVVPDQKLRIVEAFKANGEVVAMTGDGVNDAPALKAAHIGIAMGGRGTDVAREAASLVLLDDEFPAIVAAVRLGRRIYGNLRKAMAYILAIHIPIAGLALLPVLFGWPPMFFPVHVAFLEFIIDPACSIVFEAERGEADAMRRPPRKKDEPLFGGRTLLVSLLQGAGVLAATVAVFGLALHAGMADGQARAMTFATLVVSNLALIFANRSWATTVLGSLGNPNRALWIVTGGTLVGLIVVLELPVAQHLFHFASVPLPALGLAALAGLVGVGWFEVYKVVERRLGARL